MPFFRDAWWPPGGPRAEFSHYLPFPGFWVFIVVLITVILIGAMYHWIMPCLLTARRLKSPLLIRGEEDNNNTCSSAVQGFLHTTELAMRLIYDPQCDSLTRSMIGMHQWSFKPPRKPWMSSGGQVLLPLLWEERRLTGFWQINTGQSIFLLISAPFLLLCGGDPFVRLTAIWLFWLPRIQPVEQSWRRNPTCKEGYGTWTGSWYPSG